MASMTFELNFQAPSSILPIDERKLKALGQQLALALGKRLHAQSIPLTYTIRDGGSFLL